MLLTLGNTFESRRRFFIDKIVYHVFFNVVTCYLKGEGCSVLRPRSLH